VLCPPFFLPPCSGNIMPKPKLKIVGTDGNIFALLGEARKVAIANKMDWATIQKEAIAGDYDNALQVFMKHFDVE